MNKITLIVLMMCFCGVAHADFGLGVATGVALSSNNQEDDSKVNEGYVRESYLVNSRGVCLGDCFSFKTKVVSLKDFKCGLGLKPRFITYRGDLQRILCVEEV